jgi:hypothetical protein
LKERPSITGPWIIDFSDERLPVRSANSNLILLQNKELFDEGFDGKERTADGVPHFGSPRSGDLLLCYGFSHNILRGVEFDEL